MASKRSGVRSPSAPLICSSSRPADAGLSRSSRPDEQPSARSPALAPSGESHASLGGTVALGRTFVLLVLPIGAVVIALLTDTSPGRQVAGRRPDLRRGLVHRQFSLARVPLA